MKQPEGTDENVVALIEVGESHDECLYSQIFALKNSGRKVLLICTEKMRARNPHFEEHIFEYYSVSFSTSGIKNMLAMKSVLKYMKRKNVSRAILNTAQGTHIRNLCLLSRFSKIEYTGIIHTTRKFEGSFTHRVIGKKVKKFLLLSEHLLSTVQAPAGTRLDYFYPIRYWNENNHRIESHKFELTIIGGVEKRRKDLDGFVDMIKGMDDSVRFTFLGKSDMEDETVRAFQKRLKEEQLENAVVFFDRFVSHEEFSEQLRRTDAILPLVHPDTPSAEQYFKKQISGAMNVAFGYKIPLLIHEAYRGIEEMKDACLYYDPKYFCAMLKDNKDALKDIAERMTQNEKYNAEHQESRYLKFVFS